MTVIIRPSTDFPDKLADAELHFDESDGLLAGLKLVGFSIWERRSGTGYNVTFPARQYSVNGERRSFALLRSADVNETGAESLDPIKRAIVAAFVNHEETRGAYPAPWS